MIQYIAIAVIMTVIICLIYWIVWRDSDKKRRKKSEKHLASSAGVFDDGARRALDELTKIESPDAADFFHRGNIVRYNILGGDIQRTHNTRHRAAIGHVVRDYTDTLLGMRGRVAEIEDPGFMINHLADFDNTVVGIGDEEHDILAQLFAQFHDTVIMHEPAVRREIINDRIERVATVATTRSEAVNLALGDAIKFTDDRQNVHDSKVNNDLREILIKLKSTTPSTVDSLNCIEEAADYVINEYPNHNTAREKSQNIMRTLDQIRKRDRISTFNDTEDMVFAYVWSRCDHPKNAKNSDLMRDAVMEALADCVENGTLVCTNGRCGRILNSLVTLDYDKEISENGVMTFEAYRNQIFQETKTIINQEIDRAMRSSNDELRAVGEAYETGEESSNIAAETEFKNEIKREIDRNIDSYASKFSEKEMNDIKQECYVYATI